MTAEVFLDTNVIVYAVDTAAPAFKRERARAVLREGRFALSTQVLQEFYITVTRKLETPLSPRSAARWVEQLSRAKCVAVDVSLVKLAITHSERFRISYWDAAILAAAEMLGVERVLTEDLNHGQRYAAMRVENPFVKA